MWTLTSIFIFVLADNIYYLISFGRHLPRQTGELETNRSARNTQSWVLHVSMFTIKWRWECPTLWELFCGVRLRCTIVQREEECWRWIRTALWFSTLAWLHVWIWWVRKHRIFPLFPTRGRICKSVLCNTFLSCGSSHLFFRTGLLPSTIHK